MTQQDNQALAHDLVKSLSLSNEPLAIHFTQQPIDGVEPLADAMPEAATDGRTGRAPAGCAFWMAATQRTFSTVAEDHANCSVGSVTHGFKTIDEISDNMDVGALLEAHWVAPETLPELPVVTQRYQYVTYGPLKDSQRTPDVVFLRINAKQAMHLSDALPDLLFEGKPQCHIIPIAKQRQQAAVSVGCMLSRVRTAMPNTEMTCALPGAKLAEMTAQIKTTVTIDNDVARYASHDKKRFF